jgi:hypothetical protein
MVMFLASSIPLLTIQIDYVLQSNRPSMKKVAADIYAAGYIILVLVQVSFSTQ